MSTQNEKKLGTLRLTDGEKKAIALMVDSEGFKIWKKKVMPNRELQIAGACLQAVDQNGLFRAKGQSYENGRAIKALEEIAAAWSDNQLNEDASE